ncbi:MULTISPECIES: hypothetical protein [unclassified Fusibacter]|uniref:hypothetical protein n=1 Tax=unclassified Fusibacter TaxID=2624464 RepID=UPI00101050EF|nr:MULTISPECIES: hypothetical protein [unclassified Fusibacter]MCK8060907.1 hypothetical protein [Fusibacter sp. A2]NPE23203.1 hypothetical protein [Fusibacter sp. A1]RXV59560.1 hypothetical protein DWB64_15335 [Fusibacter sp. A1]
MNYENLIVRGMQWVKELPHHEGQITEKGYPVIMSNDLVKEAQVWVCPALMVADERVSKAIEMGMMGKAVPHVHDGDEMYLIVGEEGSTTVAVTLGEDYYELTTPAAVYIPAGLPHSITPLRATSGKFGGACPVFFGTSYETYPVPENPLKIESTEQLIVKDMQWVKDLPHHEGQIGEKGYPVIMSNEFVDAAKVWVCPALMKVDEKVSKAIELGMMGKAVPHTHDKDEMYLLVGEDDAATFEITLGDEVYDVNVPSAVYIPAGLPHAIQVKNAVPGKFGGAIPVFLGTEYITKPI